MAIALIIIGLILVIVGANNKTELFTETITEDLGGFAGFFIAIIMIGALGTIKPLRGVSDGFLILVFLVIFLTQGTGIFDRIRQEL